MKLVYLTKERKKERKKEKLKSEIPLVKTIAELEIGISQIQSDCFMEKNQTLRNGKF